MSAGFLFNHLRASGPEFAAGYSSKPVHDTLNGVEQFLFLLERWCKGDMRCPFWFLSYAAAPLRQGPGRSTL